MNFSKVRTLLGARELNSVIGIRTNSHRVDYRIPSGRNFVPNCKSKMMNKHLEQIVAGRNGLDRSLVNVNELSNIRREQCGHCGLRGSAPHPSHHRVTFVKSGNVDVLQPSTSKQSIWNAPRVAGFVSSF